MPHKAKILGLVFLWMLGLFARATDSPSTLGPEYRSAESSGARLVVQPFFLAESLHAGLANEKKPVTVMINTWIVNAGSKPISVPASEKIKFRRSDCCLFLFELSLQRLGPHVIKPKPSEVEIVSLDPGEAVFLQKLEIAASVEELRKSEWKLIYLVDTDVAELLKIWHGEISVPVTFKFK